VTWPLKRLSSSARATKDMFELAKRHSVGIEDLTDKNKAKGTRRYKQRIRAFEQFSGSPAH
jgi:predicted metal-dependent phosphoesterase TrpH